MRWLARLSDPWVRFVDKIIGEAVVSACALPYACHPSIITKKMQLCTVVFRSSPFMTHIIGSAGLAVKKMPASAIDLGRRAQLAAGGQNSSKPASTAGWY